MLFFKANLITAQLVLLFYICVYCQGLAKLGALEDMPSEDKSDVGGTESSRKPSATEDESQNTTESLNAASIYSNSACDNGQNTAENSTSLKVPVRSVSKNLFYLSIYILGNIKYN